jgi:hypothetical protein
MFHEQILLTGVMPKFQYLTAKNLKGDTGEVGENKPINNDHQISKDSHGTRKVLGKKWRKLKICKLERTVHSRKTNETKTKELVEGKETLKILNVGKKEEDKLVVTTKMNQSGHHVEKYITSGEGVDRDIFPEKDDQEGREKKGVGKNRQKQREKREGVVDVYQVKRKGQTETITKKRKKRKRNMSNLLEKIKGENSNKTIGHLSFLYRRYNHNSKQRQARIIRMNRITVALREKEEEEKKNQAEMMGNSVHIIDTQDVVEALTYLELHIICLMEIAPRCKQAYITNLGGAVEDVKLHVNEFLNNLFGFKGAFDPTGFIKEDMTKCGHLNSTKNKMNLSIELNEVIRDHCYMTDFSGREFPTLRESYDRRDEDCDESSLHAWMGYSMFMCLLKSGALYRESTSMLSSARPIATQLTNWSQPKKGSWKVILLITGLNHDLRTCLASVAAVVRNYIRDAMIRQGDNEISLSLDEENIVILWRLLSIRADKVIPVGEIMIPTNREAITMGRISVDDEDMERYIGTTEDRIASIIFGAVDSPSTTVKFNEAVWVRFIRSEAVGNAANPNSNAIKRTMIEELNPVKTMYAFLFKRLSAHPNLIYIIDLLMQLGIPSTSIVFAAYSMSKETARPNSHASGAQDKWDVKVHPIIWINDPDVAYCISQNTTLVAMWLKPLWAEEKIIAAIEYRGDPFKGTRRQIHKFRSINSSVPITMGQVWDKIHRVRICKEVLDDMHSDMGYMGPYGRKMATPQDAPVDRSRSRSPLKRHVHEISKESVIPSSRKDKEDLIHEILEVMVKEDTKDKPMRTTEFVMTIHDSAFHGFDQYTKEQRMEHYYRMMLEKNPGATVLFMQQTLEKTLEQAEELGINIDGDGDDDMLGDGSDYNMDPGDEGGHVRTDAAILNESGSNRTSSGDQVISSNAFAALQVDEKLNHRGVAEEDI